MRAHYRDLGLDFAAVIFGRTGERNA